jgi:ABC-type nitrate/sulfonate/bicarbonate transport system substrate-binding protein
VGKDCGISTLFVALLVGTACGGGTPSSGATAENPSTVQFAIGDPAPPVLIQAGIKGSEFAHLQMKFVVVDGCVAALPLFQNGSLAGLSDCAEPPIPIAHDKHIPFRVVYDNGSAPIFLLARPGIKSASDLKGKTIAAVGGSSGYFSLQNYLKKNGLGLSDVKYVDMPVQQQVAAFITKQIDAAYTWDPANSALRKAGAIELDTTPTGGYTLFSGDFITKHPAVVQAWVCSMTAVARRLQNSPASVYADMAAANNESVETVKSQLQGQVLAQVDQYNADWMGTVDGAPTHWANFISDYSLALVQQGRISAPMTPEQVQAQFDPRFVKVAHDGGCK